MVRSPSGLLVHDDLAPPPTMYRGHVAIQVVFAGECVEADGAQKLARSAVNRVHMASDLTTANEATIAFRALLLGIVRSSMEAIERLMTRLPA